MLRRLASLLVVELFPACLELILIGRVGVPRWVLDGRLLLVEGLLRGGVVL